MKHIEKYRFDFWAILFLQSILILIGFKNILLNGNINRNLFMGNYDGIRNFYAYSDYITQGKANSFFLFKNMNYPFGDYIFYTDNTPILAVLVKWFSEQVYDVSGYSLAIFNAFFCFQILISSLLVYLIGKHFLKNKWILALASISIPWLSPQLFRLGNGHFSLALTGCILLVIYGLIRLYFRYNEGKACYFQ